MQHTASDLCHRQPLWKWPPDTGVFIGPYADKWPAPTSQDLDVVVVQLKELTLDLAFGDQAIRSAQM